LAFDVNAHAFELAGIGVAPSLVAQQLASFGVGLLELDPLGIGCISQFVASGLQQFAVSGVVNGFLLNGGVDNDAARSLMAQALILKYFLFRNKNYVLSYLDS
jgi:hypothetical protein